MGLVDVTCGVVSPRVPARDEVVAIFGLRANEGTSSVFGMVIDGVDRPLGWLWVDSCWLDTLGRPVSP